MSYTKKIAASIVGLLLVPVSAHADLQSDLLAQLNALLAQVATLQAQLNATQSTTISTTPSVSVSTSPIVSVSCPTLTQTLGYGDAGSEVTALQKFLAQDAAIYPEGTVSGYFGTLTQRAVQRWQAAHAVVSEGTPATTGYGSVGPKTRAAIASICNTGSGANVVKNLIITPIVGQLPLAVVATFSLATPCTGFTLDWGDGSTPVSQTEITGGMCAQVIANKRVTHTYNKLGVHTATLRTGSTVETVQVSVGVPEAINSATLYPVSGAVPFTTSVSFPVSGSNCTSYRIDWGDGDLDEYEAAQYEVCAADYGTQATSHTYEMPGEYHIALRTGHAPLAQLSLSSAWDITVSDAQNADFAFGVSPVSGSAPMTVTVQLANNGEACASYLVDWGDGSAQKTQQAVDDTNCLYSSASFTHLYQNAGTYPVSIKLGEGELSNMAASIQYVTVQ